MRRLLAESDAVFLQSQYAEARSREQAVATFRSGRRAQFWAYIAELRADSITACELSLHAAADWGEVVARACRIEYHVFILRACCVLHFLYLPASEIAALHIDALCAPLQQPTDVIPIR